MVNDGKSLEQLLAENKAVNGEATDETAKKPKGRKSRLKKR